MSTCSCRLDPTAGPLSHGERRAGGSWGPEEGSAVCWEKPPRGLSGERTLQHCPVKQTQDGTAATGEGRLCSPKPPGHAKASAEALFWDPGEDVPKPVRIYRSGHLAHLLTRPGSRVSDGRQPMSSVLAAAAVTRGEGRDGKQRHHAHPAAATGRKGARLMGCDSLMAFGCSIPWMGQRQERLWAYTHSSRCHSAGPPAGPGSHSIAVISHEDAKHKKIAFREKC
ncbi:hypothetical protein PAL_GLEAN10024705 [Pteropus alecto]|uniref:Uncharacterized protein n=1 Tax=Pteropus alecto TaxID=9402 RepID=L5JZB6_PTEAL|nr:hypothetical protein PAL_GLEAN10024705 [Pteropus alecto]